MKDIRALRVDTILDRASNGTYQIPKFQREFVWTNKQICELVVSAFQGLPCGSIVTWENPKDLKKSMYHPVRIEQKERNTKKYVNFPPKKSKPDVPYIIIDGQQRITALSIAFGGLRNKNANYRFGGKFFVNLDEDDVSGSVSFIKSTIIKKKKLDKKEGWLKTGLFPLNLYDSPLKTPIGDNASFYWMTKVMPLVINSKKRKKRVEEILQSLSKDIMAELPLEKTQTLGSIANSFEKLNTQGTPVAMVDVLHNILFEWFKSEKHKEFLLRDWIDSINETQSTLGWGREKRQKIILQFAIAIELALDARLPARNINTKLPANITNKDILNVNEQHWSNIQIKERDFINCIHNFQLCVMGTQFPEIDCPYPISGAVYVALNWKLKFDNVSWNKKRLDQIFRAFFWSNALSLRYETDSLGVPKDINAIKTLLHDNANKSDKDWERAANDWLDDEIRTNLPQKMEIVNALLGKTTGAFKQTLQLPIKYNPKKDILNLKSNISYPSNSLIQIHHIFPKKWVNDNENNFGNWSNMPDKIKVVRECLANKTPLLDATNIKWSSKAPGMMISSTMTSLGHQAGRDIWVERFIDNNTYDFLKNDIPRDFLERRANAIAKWLLNQTILK